MGFVKREITGQHPDRNRQKYGHRHRGLLLIRALMQCLASEWITERKSRSLQEYPFSTQSLLTTVVSWVHQQKLKSGVSSGTKLTFGERLVV